MAYKEFTAGQEALAADVNTLYMQQTVARFPTAAARTAAIVAPALNQLSMTDDKLGALDYWNGSSWSKTMEVQGAQVSGTTNANGDIDATYARVFAGGCFSVVASGAGVNFPFTAVVLGIANNKATIRCFGPGVLANTAVTVNYIAMGFY